MIHDTRLMEFKCDIVLEINGIHLLDISPILGHDCSCQETLESKSEPGADKQQFPSLSAPASFTFIASRVCGSIYQPLEHAQISYISNWILHSMKCCPQEGPSYCFYQLREYIPFALAGWWGDCALVACRGRFLG